MSGIVLSILHAFILILKDIKYCYDPYDSFDVSTWLGNSV